MILEAAVLGKPILVELHRLDCGLDVGIYGGDSTHVGAVSLADPGGEVQTLERCGHKDGVVSAKWAETLAKALHTPVAVRCGIHFDHVKQEELSQILRICDELLKEAERSLK